MVDFLIFYFLMLDVVLLGVVKKSLFGAFYFSPIWLVLAFAYEGGKETTFLRKLKFRLIRPLIMLVFASMNIFIIAGILELLLDVSILSSWRWFP